jgi:hypothetical protein
MGSGEGSSMMDVGLASERTSESRRGLSEKPFVEFYNEI